MKTFDVQISVTIYNSDTGYQGGQVLYENIAAKRVPSKLIYALLTWIFKLTEGYTIENG